MTPRWRAVAMLDRMRDVLLLIGVFALASALAGLFGAANLGTALAFGQIAFAAALVYVLLRR